MKIRTSLIVAYSFLICLLNSQIVSAQLTASEKEQVKINTENLLKQAIELEDIAGVSTGLSQNGNLVSAQLTASKKEQVKINAENLLKQAIELDGMVGVSAGVSQNGDIIWKGGAGWRDRENKIPAKSNMLHRTASIAKPITAVAVMQLVEQGKLDLDIPIQNYLPEFPKKPEGDITTRHLLNHLSGIKDYRIYEFYPKKHYPTLLDAMATFKKRNLAFVPGTNYLYTTYNYVVLGAIIEKVSGKNFGAYMEEHVWKKANMEHTSLEVKGQSYPNKTKLYKKSRITGRVKNAISTDLSLKYPGGGMQTTVEDLLNFGQALMDNKLISAKTFEMMLVPTDKKKKGNSYGLGFQIYDTHPTYGRTIGHSGSQSGTSTHLFILLDMGIVVSVLSNTGNSNISNLLRELSALATDEQKRMSNVPVAINLPKAVLKQYAGTYQVPDKSVIKIKQKKNYLIFKTKLNPNHRIYPQAEHRFFFRVGNWFIEFETNQKKEITGLNLISGKKETFAKKSD